MSRTACRSAILAGMISIAAVLLPSCLASATSVTWNTTSGTWDTTSPDWWNGAPGQVYQDGDDATFGDIAVSATVTVVPGGMNPNSITIDNSANSYVFRGGPVGGGSTLGLVKSGGGIATLTGTNTYSGGTQVLDGTLGVSGDAALGAAGAANGITLDTGGVLQANGAGLVTARTLTIGAGGGTFLSTGTNCNSIIAGAATVNGALVAAGAGNLTLSGSLSFGPSGSLVVNGGPLNSLTLAGSGIVAFDNAPTINGNLVIGSPMTVDFNGVTTAGTGSIDVTNRGSLGTAFTLFCNSSGTPGGTVTNNIVLNSVGLGFQESNVAIAPFAVTQPANGGFLVGFGSNKNGGLGGTTYSGVISGKSDVVFGTNDNIAGVKSGGGGIVLAAHNTYSGVTMITGNGPDVSEVPATVIMGIDNALPTGTDLVFGYPNTTPSRNPTLDLNGHSQTVRSICSTDLANASHFIISNNLASSASTLTVGNATAGVMNPATPFGGMIRDGSGTIALVKQTASTLVLANSNAYSGGTWITGGTLEAANAAGSATGSGPVTVSANAALAGNPAAGGSVGAPGTGPVEIKSGGFLLPGGPATAGLPLNVLGNLSLDNNSIVSFDFAAGDSFKDNVIGGGGLNLPSGGHVTINLNNLGGISGELPLFDFGSVSNFSAGTSGVGSCSFTVVGTSNIPSGSHTYSFQLDSAVNPGGNPNQIDLLVSGLPIQANPTWNAGSGTWDQVTPNWANGAPNASLYKDYDNAMFADQLGVSSAVVALAATGALPGAVSVSNTATAYTLQGGPISGFAAVNKSGPGALTLASSNSYSGGTNVTGGTLIINDGDNRLGSQSGMLTINGGATVQTAGAALTSTSRNLTIGAGGGIFDTNGLNASTSGQITLNGTFTKVGGGTLTIGTDLTGTPNSPLGWTFGPNGALNVQGGDVVMNGQINFNASGTINIHPGSTVTFASAGNHNNCVATQNNGGVYDGNLIIRSTIRANFDAGNFTGAGEIQVQGQPSWTAPYTLFGNFNAITQITDSNASQSGGNIYVPIHLNSLVTSSSGFTPCDVTAGSICVPPSNGKSFIVTVGGTNPSTANSGIVLSILGGIYGYSDVIFGGNDLNGKGSGYLLLASSCHYTGATLMNGNNSVVRLGVDNAIPLTSDMVFGTESQTNAPVFDLNGFNQQVASLSYGGYTTNPNGQSAFTIKNDGSSASTLTIGGSTVPYNAFGGTISDGFGILALVRSGSGATILTGPNSYSGGTIVTGGKLLVNNPSGVQTSTGIGDVTVSGGTFGGVGNVGLAAYGTPTVSVSAGATLYPGLPASGGTPRLSGALDIAGNLALAAGATVHFDLGGGTSDLVSVASTLAFPAAGQVTVNLNDLGGGLVTGGSATLFAYNTLANAFNPLSLIVGTAPPEKRYSFLAAGGAIDVTVSAGSGNLIWSGSTSSLWAVNANFTGSQTFGNGDHVTFDDTGSGGTVNVAAGGVAPGAVAFANNNKSYELTGGPIAGASLIVSGSGSLLLATTAASTFSGGILVEDGTLTLLDSNSLADGTSLTVGSGAAFAAAVIERNVAVSAASAAASCASPSAVPEPGTTALLAAGALLLAAGALRRRIVCG